MVGESDTDREEILRARARRLAERPADPAARAGTDVLCLRLGVEEYAVELKLLREVRLAKGLTPVPGTPPHVAGILNVRGEILTVIDLAVAVGLGGSGPPSDSSPVILVDHAAGRIGLLVTAVAGVQTIDVAALERAPSGREYVRGVIEARRIVLDLDQLWIQGSFEVDEEVS